MLIRAAPVERRKRGRNMRTYEPVPEEILKEMAKEMCKVHAALSNLANRRLGRPSNRARGLSRAEGGVTIRGAPIKIRRDCVIGIYGDDDAEAAVVAAIATLVDMYKRGDRSAIEEAATGYQEMSVGDGLPGFFGKFWDLSEYQRQRWAG